MHLSAINVYPVKSCAGISLPSVELDRFGPRGDRRWMVVDAAGRFVSQRDTARMCLVRVTAGQGSIRLDCGDSALEVPLPGGEAPRRRVRVWADEVLAADAGEEAAVWFSRHLQKPCRLVYMPDETVRQVDGVYASAGETIGFADGFPLMLISQASLEDLNGRLPSPVPMNRFRPNLVVAGCEPFAEDGWRRIAIGGMVFDIAKPCARCAVPSIVQESGERDPHINRVLAGYRRFDGKIHFGQNLLYQRPGALATGDPVAVLA
jgi:uncharacterized protein YcbX